MAKKERAKKASSLLSAQMAANALKQQREVLKAQMKSLAKERKKAMRAAKALKAKANKTDIMELMQMMVMKASVMHQEAEDKKKGSSGSSSSSDPWTPSSPKDAWEKISDLLDETKDLSVEKFAEALRAKAAAEAAAEE